MDPKLESQCKEMLLKYKNTRKQLYKEKSFELCVAHIIRYVKLYLKKYRRYESQTQILSFSYDVFNVVVESYDANVEKPLTMHFSNCAKAEIRKWVLNNKKRVKNTISIEDKIIDIDTIHGFTVNPFYAIEGYISLKDFRNFLPDPYRIILDDAICSFDSTRKYRQTKPINCPFSTQRYYEAKRVLQFVAEFFLRG
jgi:hypothetical protein